MKLRLDIPAASKTLFKKKMIFRYLRPVCQVKGVALFPRLENDPWINVMNKAVQHDNGRELIPKVRRTTRNPNTKKDEQSLEKSSNDSNTSVRKNSTNSSSPLERNESESVVEEVQQECCFSVTITGTENSSHSMSTVEPNVITYYRLSAKRSHSNLIFKRIL